MNIQAKQIKLLNIKLTPDYLLLILPSFIPTFIIAFYYRTNAEFIQLNSLIGLLLIVLLTTFLVTVILLLCTRNLIKTILVASVANFLFVMYGTVYRVIKDIDIFQIEHYVLFPVFIILIIYNSYLIIRKEEKPYQKKIVLISLIVIIPLVIYNFISGHFIQTSLERLSKNDEAPKYFVNNQHINSNGDENYDPDVYYLLFDEMADTEIVEEYFDVDKDIEIFEQKLKEVGFRQYHNLHSRSGSTTYEMASRLNLRLYDKKLEPISDYDYMVNEINNSITFKIFNQNGYKTVLFPGYFYLLKHHYNIPEIPVDLIINYGGQDSKNLSKQFMAYEAIPMLFKYTMLDPFTQISFDKNTAYFANWRNFTLFAFNETPNIRNKIDGPFFYYAHFTAPHVPYVFEKNGEMTKKECSNHASCYGDQYIFVANQIIELSQKILAQYPPNRQPIIILQSDHGFRNNLAEGWVPIPDYPKNNSRRIFFATYLPPELEIDSIPENFDPVNTFQFLINQLFNLNYPFIPDNEP